MVQYGLSEKTCTLTLDPKKVKLKGGDIRVKTRGGLTALVWKDRREVYMLTCDSRKFL